MLIFLFFFLAKAMIPSTIANTAKINDTSLKILNETKKAIPSQCRHHAAE